MAKKRISRKKLTKDPDDFTGQLVEWVRNNSKLVIGGICALLALIVLIAGYRLINSRREQAAAALLSQTLTDYQQALSRKDDPDKALAKVKPGFEKLIKQYGRQPAGQAGRIIFAHAALTDHDPDEAIALYRKALADFDQDPSLTNTLRNGLASAYLQKGDNAAAIDEFNSIVTSSSPVLKDVALFHLGYLYKAAGEAQKSQHAYQQLRSDFPDSIYAEIAQEKSAG
jgi:predicted negative regulator of RcsB-dependent stress response